MAPDKKVRICPGGEEVKKISPEPSMSIGHYVFLWGKYFGFTPYHLAECGTISFKWLHWQTFYFFFIMLIAHGVFGFHLYVFITETSK